MSQRQTFWYSNKPGEAGNGDDFADRVVGLNLFGPEIGNDARGFFDSRAVDAAIGDETPDPLLHLPLAHPRQIFAIMYIRPVRDKF